MDLHEATGVLSVAINGYDSWAATHGFVGGPGTVGADGIKNLVKYALGLNNPAASYPSPGTFSNNTLSFTKNSDAVTAGDVTYTIETSPDLQTWTPVSGLDLNLTDNSTTISYLLQSGYDKLFARLKVVKP